MGEPQTTHFYCFWVLDVSPAPRTKYLFLNTLGYLKGAKKILGTYLKVLFL